MEKRVGFFKRMARFFRVVRTVGWSRAVALHRGSEPVACPWPLLNHPVYVRPRTSDMAVFRQIFKKEEYAKTRSLGALDVVIDLGANVGYSAAYFLSQFPTCRVIAVEPDPENFAILVKNLAPYGNRATCLHAGVWSHTCHVRISEIPYRDNLEWSRHVVECAADAPGALRGIGLRDLLDSHGVGRVALLKCDIEGAEVALFGPSHKEWIDRVDAMAVELHEDSIFGDGRAVFLQAMQGQPFSTEPSGEFTVCRRTGK